MHDDVKLHLARHREAMTLVEETLSDAIVAVARVIVAAYRNGKKVLVCGNGGSAADAQHFAAELIGRFLMERPSLPAVALTTDTSILTAIGNDYGFDRVFSRQVEGLCVAGDVVVGISTSGNSPNVLLALQTAREKGATTVALVGRDGGVIAPAVDIALTVASPDTPRIQEAHITIIHILCDLVEKALHGGRA